MDLRGMDSLSDWDDWTDGGPEWWLRHPLHRPRNAPAAKPPRGAVRKKQIAKKITLA